MKASRRQRSAPTISDVARRAGVSPMTVSRVINGETNVRPATRDTVNDAITALNYQPNSAARLLAGAGRNRIGLLYSDPGAAYLGEFLVGTLDRASRRDVQLVVEKCEPGDSEVEAARRLIEAGVDGLVLPPPLCDSGALIRFIIAEEVPAVLVGSATPSPELMAVGIDDREAAFRMARHIVSLGHRRIGFIAGDPRLAASASRLAGYRAALEEAELPFDEALVEPGQFSYRSGLDAAEHLLGLADPPSAVFASNDDMAAATVAAAHRRGLDVPGDLTVCGFDDIALATTIWPELTTIHQPIADMSRAALDMLVTSVRRQESPGEPHRLLPFTLIRRQSDAAPRRRPRAGRA